MACCFACTLKVHKPAQDQLRLVDLVLEIRDARIPFSSANPELDRLVQHKRRLVVLNKADLAEPDKQQVSQDKLHQCMPACLCFMLAVPAADAILLFLITYHTSLQAVLHALQQQKLHGFFTSIHKAVKVKQLLQQAKDILHKEKPNADVLMIMTIGKPSCRSKHKPFPPLHVAVPACTAVVRHCKTHWQGSVSCIAWLPHVSSCAALTSMVPAVGP